MWRAMGSLVLTFVALAWATIISAVCFFYGAGLWLDLLGRERAFYGALLMFLISLGAARLMLRLADRMIEPYSGPFDERAYRKSPRDTFYSDWQRYAGDIVRNRRYAFYARTRQWDKLAALEAQGPGAVAPPEPQRETLQPLRTSVGKDLSAEEVRRGARRNSGRAQQRVERWTALDEDEYDYEDDED
jgi:hypothetical protein